MKVKRFEIVRLPFDCETSHPILAGLFILSRMHKLIKFGKIQYVLNGKEFGKPFYRLYVPKIRYIQGGDAV